ncbi:alpha-(1,3)-fucosyltransferase fut-5-like [Mercenaria mercenaria]|uniref:alpha-(1,3)-fucosyltransferase fut-5-like n=1 Tax=Mercenaria mercenaria TaxID=6596 RepID=UPI00234F7B27|nr:alpha-(1,3)-fucosyltransferase fut-5-like [Mercenaria mercenaria]XP_053386514.1 alpha-(1,3)-fucosyltransferase fut-5-like [Mercenaria mercenaria]
MKTTRIRKLFISSTLTVMLILALQTYYSDRLSFGTSVVLTSQYSVHVRGHSQTVVTNKMKYSRYGTGTSIVKESLNEIISQHSKYNGSADASQELHYIPKRRKLRIALYHVYHGLIKAHMRSLNMSSCFHYQNCEVVYIKPFTTGIIDADAVLIQGNNVPNKLPKHRDKNQVFIFVTVESPIYLRFTNPYEKRVHNYFNWTMTYRIDSDIPYVYGSVIPNKVDKNYVIQSIEINNNFRNIGMNASLDEKVISNYTGDVNKNYSDIFRQKTETALWFVSHCRTPSKREVYASELAKYTNVTKVGKCNMNRSSSCPKRSDCDTDWAKKYKFYLAFENSLCIDYITEKAFLWFTRDIVIVVRGAIHYENYLPKGTFIDTNAFNSAKELAQHLNKVGANEEEYTNILKLKDHYSVIKEREHAQISYCNLCYKLNNLNQYRKSIANVNDWWNRHDCIRSNDI